MVGTVNYCPPKSWTVCSPLDLSSFVHSLSNSTTSSGSTLVRTQASDHCGFLLTLGAGVTLFFAVASLPLNTREKKGMVEMRRRCEGYAVVGVRESGFHSSPNACCRLCGTRRVHPEASKSRCACYGRAVMIE